MVVVVFRTGSSICFFEVVVGIFVVGSGRDEFRGLSGCVFRFSSFG